MEYNCRNGLIRWKVSKVIEIVPCIYALAVIVSGIFTFQMFDLEKVGQGPRAQFLQSCHSISNINMYKNRPMHFVLALTVSEILTFEMFDHEIVGQDHRVQILQWSPYMAYIKIFVFTKILPVHMKVTHIHRQTYREMNKAMAIYKIADL